MAIFRIITFLIHAIVEAVASLLSAALTHLLPTLLGFLVLVGFVVAVFTGGGVAALHRRKNPREDR